MALKQVSGGAVASRPSLSRESIRRAVEENDGRALVASADARRPQLTLAVIETDDTDVVVREVSNLWSHAQQTFLAIGSYLAQARSALQRRVDGESVGLSEPERRLRAQAEFKRLVLLRLPFGPKVASQLECVARAVYIEERLRVAELPRNYSVAYQLTTLTDSELNRARAEGIVAPDVRRDEVIAWKRRLRSVSIDRRRELETRRDHIRASMVRLRTELDEVERELAAEDAQSGVLS